MSEQAVWQFWHAVGNWAKRTVWVETFTRAYKEAFNSICQ